MNTVEFVKMNKAGVEKKQVQAILMLIAAGLIWGISFVVVKDSLDYMTPLWQLAGRLLIACGAVCIIFCREFRRMNRLTVKRGILLGVFFTAALMLQNIGCNYTSASKCAFLTGSYVAFVPLLELLFLRRKPTWRKLLAVALCMAGMAFLTLEGSLSLGLGDMLVILCGVAYAVHILYIDRCEEQVSPLHLHMLQIITATVISLAAALLVEPIPTGISLHAAGGMVYCGIFEILLGFFLQLKGQKNTNPTLAGILMSMESVYACIFAAIFLHDVFTIPMIIGCVMMFLAAVLA